MWYKIILKYWREILLLISAIIISTSVTQCNRNKSDKRLAFNTLDSAFNVAKYYQTKNGELVGQIKTHEGTIEQLRQYGEQMGFEVERLQNQVGNLKRLVGHWHGKAQLKDTFRITLHDTVYLRNNSPTFAKKLDWSNEYMTMKGILEGNQFDMNYEYNVDFRITAYYKPTGFLKPKQLVTDIYFSDPNMRVQEFRGFVVEQPKIGFFHTKFGVVTVGVGAFALGYLAGR